MTRFENPHISAPVSSESGIDGRVLKNFDDHFSSITSETGINVFKKALAEASSMTINAETQKYIKGWLSQILEKAYYLSFTSGVPTEEFSRDLQVALQSITTLPRYLGSDSKREMKREPSFPESISGTLERFSYMEKLVPIFRNKAKSIIVGGSMSYGPFYNIRKNLDETGSSDIDAIIVVNDDFFDDMNWDAFDLSEQFSEEDKKIFHERRKKFRELYSQGSVDILSQRFDVPNHDFNMSTHFFTLANFEKMCGSRFSQDLQYDQNIVSTFRDFKARKFEHRDCNQLNFFGDAFPYTVPEQVAIEGGYIAELPNYYIQNQHLYPGIYQNLISPEFLVFYDNTGEVSDLVGDFHRILQERSEVEGERGKKKSSVIQSHFRNRFFAPGRY